MNAHRGPAHEVTEDHDGVVSAEAFVSTQHSDRYLARLSRHASQMNQHFGRRPETRHEGGGAPRVRGVETSASEAVLTLGEGRCLIWARPEGLRLRVEAKDDNGLRRLEEGIAKRLQTFGSRDRLNIAWRKNAEP